MPRQSGSPTRRRRLGELLRNLREAAGTPVDDVRKRLRCSQSKISRIETGRVPVNIAELELLLAFYGASEPDRDRAIAMWEESMEPTAHLDYLKALPARMRGYSRLEAEASLIQTLQPIVMPGLLQIEDYARALHLADRRFCPAEIIDSQIAARMARQRRLTEPFELHAVIGESVIRTPIGGPVVQRSQLRHLLDMAQRPNITIQVVPFNAGAYGSMSGAFTILNFSDQEDLPSVYLEYTGGGAWAETPAAVERFGEAFADAAEAALSTQETIRFLHRVLRGEQWPTSAGIRAATADR